MTRITDETRMRSDAWITRQDMEAICEEFVYPEYASLQDRQHLAESNAHKTATRLNGDCTHRGGRVHPLRGLPHTMAARFKPDFGSPEYWYVHDMAELARHPRYPRWPDTRIRMISRYGPSDEILIYTDRACLDQHISGDATRRKGGCAVIYKRETRLTANERSTNHGIPLRLESAKSYWEKLLSQVNLHAHWGCEFCFWLIPRSQNACADAMAKHAAANLNVKENYTTLMVPVN
jgi:hypothetical protein